MPAQKPIFLCFPGFLGLPSDFEPLRNINPDLDVVDVCGRDAPEEGQSWIEWQQRLLSQLNQRYSGRSVIVIGYSMGARICLGLLREKPDWLRSAILMSCHPGLNALEEREARFKSDLDWAKRFREDPWEPLLKAWNQQAALLNTAVPKREEKDFSRQALARSLAIFSLGLQDNLEVDSIETAGIIFWGERDSKFKALAGSLGSAFTQMSFCEVPQAGHGVLIDNPAYMAANISKFIVSQIP